MVIIDNSNNTNSTLLALITISNGRQKQNNFDLMQGYIKFVIIHPWGGEFIKPVGEEYQVLKEGREYHGCGEEYNVD